MSNVSCRGRTYFSYTSSKWRSRKFSSHCLWLYLPKIARDLLQEHDVGLGVFAMKGFERRNKESKNTFKRFNNRKGNALRQNIARLSNVFTNSANSYWLAY